MTENTEWEVGGMPEMAQEAFNLDEDQRSEPNVEVDMATGEIIEPRGDLGLQAGAMPVLVEYVWYGKVGLEFKKRLTWEAAESLVNVLWTIDKAVQFYWGDFMLMAEEEFGEEYTQLIPDDLGLDKKTLINYRWVASKIPPERRREELHFKHHELVAKMEPDMQDRWLARAVADGLSVQSMRKAIRESQGIEAPPVMVECPGCGHIFNVKDAQKKS